MSFTQVLQFQRVSPHKNTWIKVRYWPLRWGRGVRSVLLCSGYSCHKSHRRGSWHSCVGQVLLVHGLSGQGKLLNHTSSEVGKSCLSSASAIFRRGNAVLKFSATGKGVRCFPCRPEACAALCASAGCPRLPPAWSREAAVCWDDGAGTATAATCG